MDKLAKALARLSKRERASVRLTLKKLEAGNLEGLNLKKLVGQQDIFRVRKGDVRIIFRRTKGGALFVLAVERRSKSTYRSY